MNIIKGMLERVTKWGVAIGSAILVIGMLIMMNDIIGRTFRFSIPGSVELFRLIMAIPIGFGLVYTALKKGHVVVELLISRFSPKLGATVETFVCLFVCGVWAVVGWAAWSLAYENGLREFSKILKIPYMPFRIIWAFCFFLLSLAYLIDAYQAARRMLDK